MTDWQGRRVLVTGIYGFLASHLAEELLARGAAVIGLYRDRPVDSYLQLSGLEGRVTLVQGDITDLEACRRVVNEHEVQVVFHLAAQAIVGLANRSPYSTLESNVRGTYTLLEACRELQGGVSAQPTGTPPSGSATASTPAAGSPPAAPAPRPRSRGLVEAIVVASSDKAYGDQPELPYQEQAPLLGLHPYDASKSCADLLARMFAHTYGLPVAVTRCANLYGPGDPSPSRIVPATMLSLIRRERPVIRSDGSPLRDYLFVRDAVGAYLALAQAVAEGPAAGRAYNIGTGVPVSVLELVEQIVAVSGVDLPPEVQNTASGEIVHQYLDVRRAAEEIGWQATTPLAAGLSATFAWYKSIHDRHS